MKWEIPIGTVHVLAALYPRRLRLAANQGKKSFHSQTPSNPPLAGGANAWMPAKNARKKCPPKMPVKSGYGRSLNT